MSFATGTLGPPLRAMTTDEAFEHALRIKGADPESHFADCLRGESIAEFFAYNFHMTEEEAAACCAYFAVRANFAIVLAHD